MEKFTTEEQVQLQVQTSDCEKKKMSRETLGKYFYDLSKIVFTALVVGSVVTLVSEKQKLAYLVLAVVGAIACYIFAKIGNNILNR